MEAEFVFVRATKRTYRFSEVPVEGEALIIGEQYVKQSAFESQPKRIKITVEVIE